MIALKKVVALTFCIGMLGTAFAQDVERKNDLGLVLNSNSNSRIGFEYRSAFGERSWFKVGGLVGVSNGFFNQNGTIIFSSDSSVTQQFYNSYRENYGVTLGFEKATSNSVFSFETGVDIMYYTKDEQYFNQTSILSESGWEFPATASFDPFLDPGSSTIRRHFLNPMLYGGFNINMPLGDDFIFTINTRMMASVPVYMGATRIQDPMNKFIGNPPTIFNWEGSVGFRLRYLL